jgi:hypothetical protein
MRIRCAAIVEAGASLWDKDKGSDVKSVDNRMKTDPRSRFDRRDIFSQLSTFLRQELVGI